MDQHSLSIFIQTYRERGREGDGKANISPVLWMYTVDDAMDEENSKPWVAVWTEGDGSVTKTE